MALGRSGYQLSTQTARHSMALEGHFMLLTNRQGASIASGDVVVLDTANTESCKLTTVEGDRNVIGVVAQESDGSDNPTDKTFANLATTYIQFDSVCPKVKVTAATAIGDYLIPSTTAGQAKPTSVIQPGAFAMALSSTVGAGNVIAMLIPPWARAVSFVERGTTDPTTQLVDGRLFSNKGTLKNVEAGALRHIGGGPGALVKKSATQNIAINTTATLTWDQEDLDDDTMHDTATNNSRITFNAAGVYIVVASVESDGNANWGAFIRKNGVGGALGGSQPANDAANQRAASAVCVQPFVATDYVEAIVANGGTGAINIQTTSRFFAIRIHE